jgi:hypothetical protein
VAETNGLLNRRTGKSGTEGSNPSVSAKLFFRKCPLKSRKRAEVGAFVTLECLPCSVYVLTHPEHGVGKNVGKGVWQTYGQPHRNPGTQPEIAGSIF